MKRIITAVLALCMLMSTAAFAAETKASTIPAVRVNGAIIEFPDAQPYIDENNRTMMPVRFVVEALGAEAEWDGANRSAIITKDDICIIIPISSNTLDVTENGVKRTVTMDTCAVLKNNRTFIPIRFIAEALGAYVDYSNAYKTVGIYHDELTAEEIATLRSYDYTQPTTATGYEESKAKNKSQSYMNFYYGGAIRETFGNYANAREYLYQGRDIVAGTRVFPNLNLTLTNPNTEEFYDAVVREAQAAMAYNSENLSVEFRTDDSCIYHADNKNFLTAAVRGIVVVKLNVAPTALSGREAAALCTFGFSQLCQGVELYSPIDIHMNTASSNVTINTYAPLTPPIKNSANS